MPSGKTQDEGHSDPLPSTEYLIYMPGFTTYLGGTMRHAHSPPEDLGAIKDSPVPCRRQSDRRLSIDVGRLAADRPQSRRMIAGFGASFQPREAGQYISLPRHRPGE
ncbi:MAG: hypothetical protein ACLRWQ_03540 [Flavonifractor plautii]